MTNIYKNREIPKFLLDKRYLFGSVVFILTFSILFMAIYAPFSNTAWFGVRSVMELNMTITFYIVALAIMFISKMLMNMYQKHIRFTYAKYIAWIVVEILVISIFYTHFTLLYMPMQEVDEITILMKALGCIIIIIAIPYTMLTLYAAYRDKTEELQMLQYEMSIGEGAVSYPSLVNLYDYNGTLKLTINSDSLYYMESQDNYVKIYYENQGKLLSYMLRCRTKAIEENLAETSMVRCHRSYIVNINKIRFLEEERRLHYLSLDDDSIRRIPVSKSYYETLVAIISPKKQETQVVTPTTEEPATA